METLFLHTLKQRVCPSEVPVCPVGRGFRDLGPSFDPGSALIHTSSWLVVSCRHFTVRHKDLNPISLVIQSCLTLYDPMDCSPPGSSTTGFSGQES